MVSCQRKKNRLCVCEREWMKEVEVESKKVWEGWERRQHRARDNDQDEKKRKKRSQRECFLYLCQKAERRETGHSLLLNDIIRLTVIKVSTQRAAHYT